jgi:hypothetical protein
VDEFGGFSVVLDQYVFGHRALKPTWIYVSGASRSDIPPIPLRFGHPPRVINNPKGLKAGMRGYRKECTKPERESTPLGFALWMIEVAEICGKNVVSTLGGAR